MSANSWAPSGDAEDPSLIDRLEQMIAPSFDDTDLPRPADPSAELPWLSGGPNVAIAPEFDTEGLPQVAGQTPPAPAAPPTPTATSLPPPAPASVPAGTPVAFAPPPPAAPVAPVAPAPPATPPGLGAPAALPAPSSAPVAIAASPAQVPPPPPATTAPAPSAWGSPDPAAAVPLPSPDQVREAREKAMAMQQRPRTPLLIGLAASVVALVAMGAVVLRGGEAPQETPIAVLAPDAQGPAAPDAPLVLPSFTPVVADWESMTVRFEVGTDTGRRTVDVAGPADLSVVSVVENLIPSDPSAELLTQQRVLTRKAVWVADGDTWTRDKSADDSEYTIMSARLTPRSFEDVIPVEARPLVDVVSVEDLDDAGLRRYTLDLRTATFATQYPALFESWSARNLWSAPVGERAGMVVDVDANGVVRSTTIQATNGPVTLSSVLSEQASPVSVPR